MAQMQEQITKKNLSHQSQRVSGNRALREAAKKVIFFSGPTTKEKNIFFL